MLKPLAIVGLMALWSVSFQQGCDDARKAVTRLRYYPIRDMRQTVAVDIQRDAWSEHGPVRWGQAPDSLSVPTIGRVAYASETVPYEVSAVKLVAPPATEASIAHGDSLFRTVCWTCHGKTMVGDGPVSAKFVPPPDLLAQMTRERTDGYIYRYMRHGGALMPAYGNMLSAHDAWSLVHYIRHMQKTSPR